MTNPAAEVCDPELARIWTDAFNVGTEWAWWTDVMAVQHRLGLEVITIGDLQASAAALRRSRPERALTRINEVERITHHDLMARLQVWSEISGHQHHHLGLTSADVVENVTQIRIRKSLDFLGSRYGLDVSHLDEYPLRGVHGPVGTDQDQLDLLGSAEAVQNLNRYLAGRWGFVRLALSGPLHEPLVSRCVPQVQHRSYDLGVLAPVVSQVKAGQAGRSPWARVLGGYLAMIAGYVGDTWNEGDVSSSVVRRVALPNLILSVGAALKETS